MITDKKTQTEISEIFSSLQGEGPYLGVQQIFVRFGRCNMHCGYCDELEKMKEERFSVYTLEALTEEVERFEKEKGGHHSVSLTGGEPLFYASFLKNFMPELKERGFVTYLETNGTLPRELDQLIRWCDIIAMDLKPASSTGDREFWKEHEEFLKIAVRKEVFVKAVITPSTRLEDVLKCARLVEGVNPNIPFIFQPVSDTVGINMEALHRVEQIFFPEVTASLHDVRVIPQMHKIWGVR